MEGQAAEASSSGGGLDLGSHLESVVENIKNDPELKLQLAQELEQAGVNPALMRAILPEGISQEELEQARQKQAMREAQQAQAQGQAQAETETMDHNIQTSDLLEFVEEISNLAPDGKDTTLGDLESFARDNPEVVQRAIDMKL